MLFSPLNRSDWQASRSHQHMIRQSVRSLFLNTSIHAAVIAKTICLERGKQKKTSPGQEKRR
jgi:hypothetical protein